jgi:hypothetical protein
VLTDRRLIFGTAREGILVDLATAQIKQPAITAYRFTMSHLTVTSVDGLARIFVTMASSARAASSPTRIPVRANNSTISRRRRFGSVASAAMNLAAVGSSKNRGSGSSRAGKSLEWMGSRAGASS